MTFFSSFKQTFYFILWAFSILTSVYFIYLNVDEIIKRIARQDTLFYQMSWLTNGQAVWYCSILTIVFIIFLTMIGHKLYHKNKKGATLVSLLTLAVAIVILFGETLLYNKPV